ncbi:MAG TPA: TRAP transporter large permease subunit [Gammaproteobacteria bacterium]|nr:TRAP transporter large permease subunit [Gammaproteobacteria bacterium]
MELYFLVLLIAIMAFSLSSGFPVAFSLPGSAILTIGIAALCGWIFEGNTDAYFILGGPNQWLSAGVTNFRSLYWVAERDTLIAIPLFIFMGIMLQRSKIAEDLLVAMAQLFGPIPGGLGISVVFVGALLAATTGIVGATVIAMGLISLPAMLRNNYSKPLACGTICASGTLGQIIPPSIVLIILADQLSNAADQAATIRKADYKAATGSFSMPGDFDVVTASAGDMFMGAFVPGMILVGIYMLYILISALIKPENAPPVPFEGEYDRKFLLQVVLALVPPLALIFMVLGSIILGVATVNQAGAIGAIGAMMMGSYRLMEGKPRAYWPATMAIVSIIAVAVLVNFFDLNIKDIKTGYDAFGIVLAGIAALVLLYSIGWAIWRAYRIDDTLNAVMLDTAKTTSMVFIILLGAAMLTSAFRGFGGEELVKEHLTALPGGFWTQFIVVMAVIFFLGFFLDFLEIAVVVVPIVAPILLADPGANVTAVWFGVMVGLNIQTSFLTPPFGFSLFYLRGVAPPSVKTTQIYRGAAAFIVLQLMGLAIAGAFPNLVNYLPNKTHLTSDTAPPPSNPKLQECLEDYLFEQYDDKRKTIESAIERVKGANLAYLPDEYQERLNESYREAGAVFSRVEAVREAASRLRDYAVDYRPLHVEVRQIQSDIRDLGKEIEELDQTRQQLRYAEIVDEDRIAGIERVIDGLEKQQQELKAKIPDSWEDARAGFNELAESEKRARLQYRQSVDDAYAPIRMLRRMIDETAALTALGDRFEPLRIAITEQTPEQAMEAIEALEDEFNKLAETHRITGKLARARRALRGDEPDLDKAVASIAEAGEVYRSEVAWRQRAANEFSGDLEAYNKVIAGTIGVRMQARLDENQADSVASCLAIHKDLTLYF